MVRHALALEDKQSRRETILAAARTLFVAGDGSLPAAAQIAVAAGLAKGTVYLYFRTKEEIFVALLLEGLLTLFNQIDATFAATKGGRSTKTAAFITTYVRYVDQRPDLLRLDTMSHSVLEKNLQPAKLREFKLAFVVRLTATSGLVEHALRLAPGEGIPLLMRTFALTRGLWQSSHADEEPTAMANDPALAALRPDFDRELTEALTEYWRGALGRP